MSMKLSPAAFHRALIENEVWYFCGVPDSSLTAFGAYLAEYAAKSHDVAVNEGSAIGLAVGYHIASAKTPLIYMQNSGLGNAMNPLISLVDPLVLGIPMILLIGWRGQPGIKDEPQHAKQGPITKDLLHSLGIPHKLLSGNDLEAAKQVKQAVEDAIKTKRPFALLVQDGTFETTTISQKRAAKYQLTREEAIQTIVDNLSNQDAVVTTTGKASRELFEYREKLGQGHNQDLLIVGGMGHASSVAYGIAKQKPEHKVFVIDGDGAVLMHMGVLPFIGCSGLKNFYHIVLNNGSHESVGGQPTVAQAIDLPAIAKNSGYTKTYSLSTSAEIAKTIRSIKKLAGPVFVEINVGGRARADLSRPTIHPSKNKESFMKFLDEN